MASITKRGSTWQARYRTPEGATRSKAFRRKVDAEAFLVSTEHRKLAGEYVDPSAGRVTFEAYAETWRAGQVHRPTAAAQVETNLRRHAYPHLGGKALSTVWPSGVQAWVKAISADLAPGQWRSSTGTSRPSSGPRSLIGSSRPHPAPGSSCRSRSR